MYAMPLFAPLPPLRTYMAGMIGLAVVVADAMMLTRFWDLMYGEMMLGLPQGRHGWGGRGEVHGWSLRRTEQREVEGRGGAFWYEVPH